LAIQGRSILVTVTFDEARGDVLPGQEWVLRVPGVVAVVRRQGDDELLAELIALIQDTVAESGPASGCMLALRLTRWLIGTTEAPAFGTVASTSDGIAVLLHGGVNLCELNGDTFAHTRDGVHLSGHTAALTVDRLMPWPDRPIALSIGTATVAGHGSLGGAPTRPVGLVHGLVPGTGVVLHPPGTGSPVIVKKAADSVTTTPGGIADESVAPITELVESRDKEFPAERIEAAPSPSVGRHAAHDGPRGLTAVIQQSDAQQPARMPGAPAEADRDPTSQSAGMSHPIPVIVEGIHCSRGHLNDPRVAFCASCGIRMDNRTAVPVHGRRPPLGLLLLDPRTGRRLPARTKARH
jgi:hypothetical protein